jgi:hypothetical protein
MTFKEYIGQDAQNPPTSGIKQDNIPQEDRARLKKYLANGQLGEEDAADIRKMIGTGYSFNDALTRALEQANHRKYLGSRQQNMP